MPRELRWWGLTIAAFGVIFFVQGVAGSDERLSELAVFTFALLIGQMLPLPPGWRERIRQVPWYLRLIAVIAVLLALTGVAVIIGTLSGLSPSLSLPVLLVLCGLTLWWVAR